jgi:hypothetical protein
MRPILIVNLLAQRAAQQWEAVNAAGGEGDWEGYGKALDALGKTLESLEGFASKATLETSWVRKDNEALAGHVLRRKIGLIRLLNALATYDLNLLRIERFVDSEQLFHERGEGFYGDSQLLAQHGGLVGGIAESGLGVPEQLVTRRQSTRFARES